MATNVQFINRVLELVNQERANGANYADGQGRPPLTLSLELTAASYMFVRDMAENNRFLGHTGSNGSSFGQRAADVGYSGAGGENAAAGQWSPESVVSSWMNSPGHRANILGGSSEIGIGYYKLPDGTHYWVQKFGGGDSNSDSFIPQDVLDALNGANFAQPYQPKPNQQVGTAGADIMNGDANNNILHGSWGNDNINGGAGNDTIYGGLDSDTITGGAGADTFVINSGPGHDIITDFQQGEDTFQFQGINENDITYSVATNNGRTDTTISRNGTTLAIAQGVDLTRFQVDGTSANDNLTGLDLSQDTLNGLAGDDTIAGLKGNDLLNGGTGNDSLNGNDGNDSLNGDDGTDLLNGGAGNDLLNGGAGNDLLNGGAGSDVLNGGNGNDSLKGEGGNDLINGDAGNDSLKGNAWSNDTLNGGAGDDRIDGGGQNNAGDIDILTGGAGADTFVLTQNQFYYNGEGHAVIKDFEKGVDKLEGLWGHSFSRRTENGRTDTLVTKNGDTLAIIEGVDLTAVTGTSGNDTLTGTSSSDTISGGAGNDSITGAGGHDLINGDAGNDTLLGNARSNDTLNGGAGDDVINGRAYTGSGEIDILSGGAGADTFVLDQRYSAYMGDGHAVIKDFNPSEDKLDGLWGHSFSRRTENGRTDTLVTRNGDTLAIIEGVDLTAITGTSGNDTLTGTSSSDTISGGAGNDSITGAGGHDLINGDAGNDTLLGNAWSNDTINGGAGDDVINGRAYTGSGENDVFTGGTGADVFVLSQRWGAYQGAGHAVITDFEKGVDKFQEFWGATVMGVSDHNNDGQMDTILSRNNDVIAVLHNVELNQAELNSSHV